MKIEDGPVILNGKVVLKDEYIPVKGASEYYEVVRIIEKKFLFLDDHLERLQMSCIRGGIKFPGKEILKENLLILVRVSPVSNGNIKLIVCESGGALNITCFHIPSVYPSEIEYLHGVHTLSYPYERPDPTVKRWNETFRKEVSIFIEKKMIYEAVLRNEKGFLTEGSRSNLFFIDQANRVITAPEDLILPGITRKYVLQICRENSIELAEQVLSLKEASGMKCCFLSGTSPKVLPVRSLDSIQFEVRNPLLANIMTRFENIIFESLAS